MKRLVLLALIIAVHSASHAQKLEIAVFTEPQFSWISSDETEIAPNGAVLNLNTGLEFDIFFMKNYAFSVGISMNNSGGKLLYSNDIDFIQTGDTLHIAGGSTLKHNLQYISVPLGLKLKSEELGYTTFYFHGGLVPMINIHANTSSDLLSLTRVNIKPNINFFNMNYFAEAGIEYRLGGNTALIAGLKWSSGFTDVSSNDLANNNINSVGLHLGILF
jgi:hypothetical protein